jgi:hypothetical protein
VVHRVRRSGIGIHPRRRRLEWPSYTEACRSIRSRKGGYHRHRFPRHYRYTVLRILTLRRELKLLLQHRKCRRNLHGYTNEYILLSYLKLDHLQHSSPYSIPAALYPKVEHWSRQVDAELLVVKISCQGSVLTCGLPILSLLSISTTIPEDITRGLLTFCNPYKSSLRYHPFARLECQQSSESQY